MSALTNVTIPDPDNDDANYFQILIVDNSSVASDEIHLTFTASQLSLTGTTIENVTWLSGGGADYTDWTTPQMNIIDCKDGVTNGPNFLQTYSVLLNALPLDSTGVHRVLKIPFLDPNDSSKSLAGSGHLTITMNTPAVMQINEDTANSTFALALPSQIPLGAGGQTKWDFVELNCATPASNSKSVCFCNTTNVDFFSLGVTIKGRQADGTMATFGIDLDQPTPVTTLLTNLKALSSDYTAGLVNDASGNYLRFLAPDGSFSADTTCLDTAISDGFNAFPAASPLNFSIGNVSYTATSNGSNQLVFSAPTAFTIDLPTTLDVIASTGPLNTGTAATTDIQNAMKFIDAALNRGVFATPANWSSPKEWYPAGVESNDYAETLHQSFIDNACYGFSYDDVPGAPVTSVPAIATCTSMTLVLTDG